MVDTKALRQVVTVFTVIGLFMTVSWVLTPTMQTLDLDEAFPNVMMVWGDANQEVVPVGGKDNTTYPLTNIGNHVRGLYQYDHFYYHKKMNDFIEWEHRHRARVWVCTLMCSTRLDPDEDGSNAMLLINYSISKTQNNWWLLEVKEDDKPKQQKAGEAIVPGEEGEPNPAPLLYARTKNRKRAKLSAPFVEPDRQRAKPKELEIYLVHGWMLFDSIPKAAVTLVVLIGSLVYSCKRFCKSEDGFDD